MSNPDGVSRERLDSLVLQLEELEVQRHCSTETRPRDLLRLCASAAMQPRTARVLAPTVPRPGGPAPANPHQAVESVYPGCLVLDPTEAQALAIARDAVAASAASGELDWAPPDIGGLLRWASGRAAAFGTARLAALKTCAAPLGERASCPEQLHDDFVPTALTLSPTRGSPRPTGARLEGAPVAVRFSLPQHPGRPARLALECSARRAVHDELSADLRRLAAEWAGGPCLLLAVDWLLVRGGHTLLAAVQ
jgi:hypothetical protein